MNGFQDARLCDEGRDVLQRNMNGDKNDTQLVICEHHRKIICTRFISKNFCMARIGDPGLFHRFFRKWRRDNASNLFGFGKVNRFDDIIESGLARARVNHAGFQ